MDIENKVERLQKNINDNSTREHVEKPQSKSNTVEGMTFIVGGDDDQ